VRQGRLLVRVLVHEHDLVAGVVQVLHVLRLGAHARELLTGPERAVDDGTAVEPLQLRADERAALARLDVLELDDAPDAAVELDVHAVLELIGVDGLGHGAQATPPSRGLCGSP
jgi:hypothetical protein